MKHVKSKWQSKNFGLQLAATSISMMTNLRFADDILLVGRTLPQIRKMIADVSDEAAKVGLMLHPDKTKILHTNIGHGSRVKATNVKGMAIEVLPPGTSAMYLGKALSLTDAHQLELSHRIKKGWAKFGMMKSELTDKLAPLCLRLKLFQTVVTPTVLYGSCSWVLTGAREAILNTSQMKMLRTIVGTRRRVSKNGETETWVDWVKRATADERELMVTHRMPSWIEAQQLAVERWYQKVKGMSGDRWARKVLEWQPEGLRHRGRPLARWEDQLKTNW